MDTHTRTNQNPLSRSHISTDQHPLPTKRQNNASTYNCRKADQRTTGLNMSATNSTGGMDIVRKIAAKKETKRRQPKIQYGTEEQVRAAAKLALITHGQAFRELANR